MMHRQLVKFFAGKVSPAPSAYPGQDLEGLIAVNVPPPFPKLARFGKTGEAGFSQAGMAIGRITNFLNLGSIAAWQRFHSAQWSSPPTHTGSAEFFPHTGA
jgi:hypothetical protein